MYNSGILFPIMVSAVVAIVVVVLVAKVQSYFTGNFVRSVYRSYNGGEAVARWLACGAISAIISANTRACTWAQSRPSQHS